MLSSRQPLCGHWNLYRKQIIMHISVNNFNVKYPSMRNNQRNFALTRRIFKTQQSYLPIWTDGVVVVFAVEVNFVLELTTSERTRTLIQLS